MTPFHVGMKVVCVRNSWRVKELCDPTVGEVVEIIEIANGVRVSSGMAFGFLKCPDNLYCSSCFRPAHENRMDELRTLLAPVPSKELVQS